MFDEYFIKKPDGKDHDHQACNPIKPLDRGFFNFIAELGGIKSFKAIHGKLRNQRYGKKDQLLVDGIVELYTYNTPNHNPEHQRSRR